MIITTPSSVITTTDSTVRNMDHMPYGVVVAEKVFVMIISGGLDSEGSSQKALQDIQTQAEALGADGIVDVNINYEQLSGLSGLMMVSVSGTAVKLEEPREEDLPF